MKKIALEEHFLLPSLERYWRTTLVNINADLGDKALGALSDFGERRLTQMDRAGIEYAVLSVAGPGVQIEPDTATAVRLAHEANDALAEEIRRQPQRYGGFAHLAMQDPKAAADELERCVRDLGFQGAMVNGSTLGEYLDADRCSPFWERAAALHAPVYLHPANPADHPAMYADHPELFGPVWSWGVETATHALRLVFAGVFERYPEARLILGHMGEALPFQLWRIDGRYEVSNKGRRTLSQPPSAYLKRNLLVTTSGVSSPEPLRCALDALGEDRVLFSADHPFENAEHAARFIEETPLSEEVRAKICFRNAERALELNSGVTSAP